MSVFKVRDDTDDKSKMNFVRIEIVPDNGKKYPYLYPDTPWKLKVDERITPTWFREEHEKLAWDAFEEWKKEIYPFFNYQEALNPINPLEIKPIKPMKEDIENLKKWDSVGASLGASLRASVRDSLGASVGASVWASVWDSVGASLRASVRDSVGASIVAYIGSLFSNIKEWKYTEKLKYEGYPFQCCVDLWKRGFAPSFDGKVWRLHSGKDAKIVYEIKKEDL